MSKYHNDKVCIDCGGPLECHRDAVCEECLPESMFFEEMATWEEIGEAMHETAQAAKTAEGSE